MIEFGDYQQYFVGCGGVLQCLVYCIVVCKCGEVFGDFGVVEVGVVEVDVYEEVVGVDCVELL